MLVLCAIYELTLLCKRSVVCSQGRKRTRHK